MHKSGMRVIIDTNCLEGDELGCFLRGDESNLAVFPEHTLIEIFKPINDEAVVSSFRILRGHPRQVLILGGTSMSAAVSPRGGAMAERLVDRQATRGFPKFCDMLQTAGAGNAAIRRQLGQRRKWALERAENVQVAFGDQSDSLAELASFLTANELRAIRSGKMLPERVRQTFLEVVRQMAANLHAVRTEGKSLYPPPYQYDQFVWRYALCHIVQLMDLLRKGATRRAPAKARNDHFDNVLATYGTYFNGLMTNDRGPMLTQHVARIILRSLGARLAVDYVESEYIMGLIDEVDKVGGAAS